ncbi:MAG TPA: glycosyltransferase family 2 protein [Chitinophagales bacterium]|nr:glycosyltransferase family 2 protein [Chitinophagales bacterium]MCB0511591.1 glycosyltransferase family 2 protein [Bacteroidota bacterium]MCB9074384.1 glycosyltransferase family 2 protein [Chitinophagales bacterium]HMU98788.1 glycosyltransferase family 2 protein [Chitinophagales bacterium]HMV02313.1 glycosyltransferase family 2 protein [Chitinophagales bacterium]
MQEKVDILLATYNGERFLQKQIDSILQQTYSNFTIYIRDDGSKDGTIKIIKDYAQKYPNKIIFIEDILGNLGVTQNFNELMKYSSANYIAFSDQDDIWLPNKIEQSLKVLADLENKHQGTPAFVYSDMQIINEEDQFTYPSFWKLASLSPKYFTFNRLLMQSIPHGCTILMNKRLKEIAFPIPQNAILHDHWLSLVTVNFGITMPILEPLILLRNHGANLTQKKTNNFKRLQRFYKNFGTNDEYLKHLNLRIEQGKSFYNEYFNQLSVENQHILEQFLLLETTSGWKRKMIYIKNKFYRTTFFHTLKMIWRA